jgi:hypothetical protein
MWTVEQREAHNYLTLWAWVVGQDFTRRGLNEVYPLILSGCRVSRFRSAFQGGAFCIAGLRASVI